MYMKGITWFEIFAETCLCISLCVEHRNQQNKRSLAQNCAGQHKIDIMVNNAVSFVNIFDNCCV